MEVGWVFSNTSVFQLLDAELNAMKMIQTYTSFVIAYCIICTNALPPSIIEELKLSEKRNEKGKVNFDGYITSKYALILKFCFVDLEAYIA